MNKRHLDPVEQEELFDGECPNCGVSDLEWGSHYPDGNSKTQDVKCNGCDAKFSVGYVCNYVEVEDEGGVKGELGE